MKTAVFIGLIIALSLVTQAVAGPFDAPAQLPPGMILHEGLVYSGADTALKMDLFLQKKSAGPVPCIIVIQGGGFAARDGKKFHPFAVYLAKNGFAAATIAYRGRPDHRYRDTVADTRAAVRYIRSVSGRYGIDPGRIGAMGRSAGATLAALLAVTGGVKEFEGDGGRPEYSSRIQAAVGYAGVYDFVARFTDKRQIAMQPEVEAKIGSNGEWIGAAFTPANEHWRRASAINHLDADDPPMLLLHCKDDPVVPWLQSRDMYAKMKEAGIPAEIEYYDTGGHGFGIPDPGIHRARMLAFFRKVLMP
jgi:acetyl esterase/lipase